MRLKRLELSGFKSFAKKTEFLFESPVTAIVGPNGSGKSNATEAFRWVLGERSLKSLRGAKGEDLIFNGGHAGARAARAAVTLVFDNSGKEFDVDYTEVSITREVYRDGQNVYSLNGTAVKFRDLLELLSRASLGTSEHFIINQGEADRVLAANPRERRSLVEDALGLRLYQWKISESEKKLLQTKANLEQVASLRREIAPHLRFLKKQMERVEQADLLRRELKTLYLEYLKREEVYLEQAEKDLAQESSGPKTELAKLEREFAKQDEHKNKTEQDENKLEQKLRNTLAELAETERNLASQQEELMRKLGRLEGVIEIKTLAVTEKSDETERDFAYREVADFADKFNQEIVSLEKLTDIFSVKSALARLKKMLTDFLTLGRKNNQEAESKQSELKQFAQERASVLASLEKLKTEASELKTEKAKLERELTQELEASREALQEVFVQKTRRHELTIILNSLTAREDKLKLERANFLAELAEAKVLVDQEISLYRNFVIAELEQDRSKQEERRKKLERFKIKLEDLGVETGDTMKEYQEVTERDAFLTKEISDLEQAALALNQVIADLREKIDQDFHEGLLKINKYFQEFFTLMFGGGTAHLAVTKIKQASASDELEMGNELETERSSEADKIDKLPGLEISVNLPRKKIKNLEMLSGGERALVSIALLFALSQVNPPPFLVLDETDAALDEANSRKYGEMIANLAKRSQLILVTHNRETMSRAGVIYGVTMSSDGISKLLSIKFDEAAAFAK
ncbi:MAG: AAA family ATPase [Patescibacteria group bacterium]